jgi:hypothetical protein
MRRLQYEAQPPRPSALVAAAQTPQRTAPYSEGLAQSRHAPYSEGVAQSRHAPSVSDTDEPAPPPTRDYNTSLLEELTRLNMTLARNQGRNGERGAGGLKPSDVGLFEPKAVPDSVAAMDFIDDFRGSARHYGEERTLAVLRKCCKNTIARAWLAGSNDVDRRGQTTSLDHWEEILRRDLMPRPTQRYASAKAEVFKWTQNRSPAEYVTHKIRLLRLAGVTNEDLVVEEIHAGFAQCTEMHIPLEPFVRETNNDVAHYRRAVQRFQDSAKLQYDYSQKPRPAAYDNRRERTPATAKQSTADKDQATSTRPSYPRKDATYQRGDKRPMVRKRKCRNFPHCGDGEHFDSECTIRKDRGQTTRAYYVINDDDDDPDDEADVPVEWRDPDDELEVEYERMQDAHFASLYRAERGFMGAAVAATARTSKRPEMSKRHPQRISPKPSECRTCRTAFTSRNQLHQHLVQTAHNVSTTKTVIPSAQEADVGDVSSLASFHYARADFQLTEAGEQTATACIDSGYGNSAVDEAFLQTVPDPVYRTLDIPVVVRGIGGAKVKCTRVAIFATYWPTMDGRLARITRPYHIFPNLGCDLLIGIDTVYLERIDLSFSAAVPQMRIGTCDAASVRITVFKKELIKKIAVRAARRTVIPPNSTVTVEIKFGRSLPPNQDYLFTPSKLRTITSTGAGPPHGLLSHDQRSLLFTNVTSTEMTIFHNTILGHVESVQKAHHATWNEATEEVMAFLGVQEDTGVSSLKKKTTFDPDADSNMPVPRDSPESHAPPHDLGDGPPQNLAELHETPRPRPVVATTPCQDDLKCAEETWTEPSWLYTTYVPEYEYDLPKGIVVPTLETSTYKLVVVNEDDDVSEGQINALKALVARLPALFNDGMGCVREPIEDWLRLPVDKDHELVMQAGRPYNVSKRGERAIDVNFDDLRAYGRLETPKRTTPWGLKVFVIYKVDKERPVIDMRPLNRALPGDSYPLPKMEDIIEPLSGMRWLGTVDITSAFYQRLKLHPDDRHRAAVVTHRGVEQFATSVMGGKTSVKHQQRLMDRRLIAQLSWRGASCYVDDIVIYAPTFQQFLNITDEVFRILSNLGITLKAKKCFLGFHSVKLLGYLVDRLGLTTTEAKADAVQNIPFPSTLAQLEHFIGLTNWNRHLIPYYAQRVAPLQAYKTALLKGAPISGRARKQYAAKTPIVADDTMREAFEDLKSTLAARPRINHVVDGQPIYAFLDSSREYGTGLAVYQLTGDPTTYSKTRLVPLHFMSRKLTPAEENYWPTDMEMSGLVWAVKRLRPYMERAYVWFVTDHKPNVNIFDMKSLVTTSTARSNLRLLSRVCPDMLRKGPEVEGRVRIGEPGRQHTAPWPAVAPGS